MTGYLQRLAAGAATVDRPIHPVLPPIFSVAGVDAGSDHRGLEEFSVSRASDVPPQSTARPAEPQRPSIAAGAAPPVATTTVAPEPGAPSSLPPPAHAHAVTAAPFVRDVSLPPVDHLRRDNPVRFEQNGERAEKADGVERDAITVHAPPRPPLDLAATRGNAREARADSAQGGAVPPPRPARTFAPLL
ncbi:MAG: hypothetical protein WCB02_08800, partial [Bradyrhizobium sp.]